MDFIFPFFAGNENALTVSSGGGGGGITFTGFTAPSPNIGFYGNSCTFTITPPNTGLTLIAVAGDSGTNITSVSLFIDGSATSVTGSACNPGLYYIAATHNTSQTVTVNFSGFTSSAVLAYAQLSGLTSNTPDYSATAYTLSASSPWNLGSTLTVNASGIGVYAAAFEVNGSGDTIPFSWIGASPDHTSEVGETSGNGAQLGFATSTSSANPSVTPTSSGISADFGMTAASWH